MSIKDIQGVLGLLAAACCLAFAGNFFSTSGIALVGQWDTSFGVVTAMGKQDTVSREIEINNPLKVRQMVQAGNVPILDVRPRDIYDYGHLPGALSFPLAEFDESLKRLASRFKKNAYLLVYCSGFDCSDSHTFASRLISLGYTRVQVYAGGFGEWEEMGFEIEKNET